MMSKSINRLISSVKKSERDAEVSEQLADLAISLSATIQSGDEDKAKSILNQLLEMKPKLDINVPKNDNVTRAHEEEFSVKVQVEDRETVAGVFSLKVKACDTIKDMKMKFYVNHRIPIEVQHWIISKRMPPDNTTLSACGVKGPGATIYLYLVTAHSVGLSREAFDANTQAYLNGTYLPTGKDRGRLSSGSGSESLMSALHSTMTSSLSPIPSTSMTPAFHNNDKLIIQVQTSPSPSNEANTNQVNTNQESSSSTWGPSSFLPSGHSPTSVPSESLGPIESVATVMEDSQTVPSTLLQSMPRPQPPQSLPVPKEQEKTVGWMCPECTFINFPTRPGCEMCSTDRPAEYEVPTDYEMTPEEVMRIAADDDMERRAREPDPALQLSFDEKQEQLAMLAWLQLQQEQTQALSWEARGDEEGFEMIPKEFLQEHRAAQSRIGGQVVADGLQPPLEPTLAWQSARDAQDSADEKSSEDSDDGANSSKA